jgi:hypothetical protein
VLAARGRTRPGPLAKLPIGIGSALESRARRSNRLREYRMETWAVRDQAHPCQLAVLSAARLSVKRPSSGDLRSPRPTVMGPWGAPYPGTSDRSTGAIQATEGRDYAPSRRRPDRRIGHGGLPPQAAPAPSFCAPGIKKAPLPSARGDGCLMCRTPRPRSWNPRDRSGVASDRPPCAGWLQGLSCASDGRAGSDYTRAPPSSSDFPATPDPQFTVCSPSLPTCSPRRYRPIRHASFMADLLVVLGIILFAALMLGLIWALERV